MRHTVMGVLGAVLGLAPAMSACAVSSDDFRDVSVTDLIPGGSSYTAFVSITGGKIVIGVENMSQADGARAQLQNRVGDADSGASNQRWAITQKGFTNWNAFYYQLANKLSNRCLDVAADVPAGDGSGVQQQRCGSDSTLSQMWVAIPIPVPDPSDPGNRWTFLVNLKSKLCLEAMGASFDAGTPLELGPCQRTDNEHQRWNVLP